MTEAVAHRGPDDSGLEMFGADGGRLAVTDDTWNGWSVGLGHRRLSIIDLSRAGHQPMCYRSRFWLTYNGEIYNFLELKEELKALGHSFRSTSDSEVILAAFAEWGPACFTRFRGMWGLVLLDTMERTAIISRDRLGIKPLYMWRSEDLVAIASEMKQFLSVPGFQRAANPESCVLYLLTGYEQPSGSMFRDVKQAAAGCWQVISLDSLTLGAAEPYWQPERISPTIGCSREASRLFAEKLTESVSLHLRSDVPIGCALSGGLDSSSIAVLINALNSQSGADLSTFSAVIPGYPKDEREFIDLMLRHIRAKPYFVTPSPEMFLEDFNSFIWTHDEPPASLSVYASYCVSRLMRQASVPVALNGQGGDEVLGGYWQLYFTHMLSKIRRGRLLSVCGNLVGSCLPGGNPGLIRAMPSMLKRFWNRSRPLLPIQLPGADTVAVLRCSKLNRYLKLGAQAQRLAQIRELFLPQLLKWEDRNFMAFSVEGRYPFLDHELIDLCLQFDPAILYHRGWTKVPLRSGLGRLLPAKIRDRRSKLGFEVPQREWLCGPLRSEIEGWLRVDRPVWAWVERGSVTKLAQQLWASSNPGEELAQMLFRFLTLDRWLELFKVSMEKG
jgi:asparagine synthase (glutamine-hydrolysing)